MVTRGSPKPLLRVRVLLPLHERVPILLQCRGPFFMRRKLDAGKISYLQGVFISRGQEEHMEAHEKRRGPAGAACLATMRR